MRSTDTCLSKTSVSIYRDTFEKVVVRKSYMQDTLFFIRLCFILYTVNHKKTWRFIFDYNFG